MHRALLVCAAITFAIACTDNITEPIVDRTSAAPGTASRPGTLAFATTTTEDGLSISTDKDDYAPGETVHFTGSGWPADDVLDIKLDDEPASHAPHTWTINVGGDGTFEDFTYVVDVGDLGVRFTLTATSRKTGRSLTVTFTDGNVRVNGTPLGASFEVQVESFSGTNANPNQTCAGSSSTGAPVSVTAVSGNGQNVGGINERESIRLTAAAASTSNGPFIGWNASSAANPYTSIDTRTICVPGFAGGGSRDYIANYTAVPDLKITKTSSSPSFSVGTNASYSLVVQNVGQLATSGQVTVSDQLPTGLTFVSASGTGWTCNATSPVSCQRSDALSQTSPNNSYPSISITFTPTAAAIGNVTNTASVAGGGDVSPDNNSSSVTNAVNGVTDLTIDKAHTGDFTRGTNEEYSLTVTNSGSGATNADVTISDVLPSGLTFVSGTGDGWNSCTASGQTVSCVRPAANTIAAGVAAPAITLTVDVGTSTASSITNTASVSGGGEPAANNGNNSDSDPTTVVNANSPPVAVNDAYSVNEDNPLSVPAPGVLGNDTDPDGNALTAVLVSGPAAASTSSFTLNADGSFDFTPATDFNGSVSFTYQANDGLVNSASAATVTITVNAVNDPPSFTKGANQTVLEDAGAQSVSPWATGISAGPNESDGVSFIVTNDNNALFSGQPAVASNGTLTYTPAANAFGSATVSVKAKDDGGTDNGGIDVSAVQAFTITVTAVNDAPSFTKGGDKTVNEGDPAQSFASWATSISAGPANENTQTLTFTVTNDNNALFTVQPDVSPTGELTFTPAAGPNGIANVTVTIQDDGGTANGGINTSPAQVFTITVDNVIPTVTIVTPLDYSIWNINGFAGVTNFVNATFTDPGSSDVHTCKIDWGNGVVHNGVITEIAGGNPGACKLTPSSNPYLSTGAGIYTLTVKVQDDIGEGSATRTLIVYDPSAGFVTGGGWITSPAGACYFATCTGSTTGKANFGFVSKYITQKDKSSPVLTGNTEFQFHAGNLNFHSENYEWLLVNQAGTNGQYKGTGSINGVTGYKFMLWATDGSYDTFRIRIWREVGGSEEVAYDNMGTGPGGFSTTPIGGGSIVVHTNGKVASK
jgi:uncharacterized repeat protein (TIGR01451 family)